MHFEKLSLPTQKQNSAGGRAGDKTDKMTHLYVCVVVAGSEVAQRS